MSLSPSHLLSPARTAVRVACDTLTPSLHADYLPTHLARVLTHARACAQTVISGSRAGVELAVAVGKRMSAFKRAVRCEVAAVFAAPALSLTADNRCRWR